MLKIKKFLKEKENSRMVYSAIKDWDPLKLVPYALEKQYSAPVRDISKSIRHSMNATQIASLIADVFSLHFYPYTYETKQCLTPALEIKVKQFERARAKKIAVAVGCVCAAASVSAIPFLRGRGNV